MKFQKLKLEAVQALQYKKEHPETTQKDLCKMFKVSADAIRYAKSVSYKQLPDGNYYLHNEDLDTIENIVRSYQESNSIMTLDYIKDTYGIWGPAFKRILKAYNIDQQIKRKSYNRDKFEVIDSEEKAYWLGFILADGSIFKNELRIKLSEKDRKHLVKFINFMESNGENGLHIQEETHGITGNKLVKVVCCDKKLVSDLKKYGLEQNKSMREKPYLDLPEEYIPHYIRGILDGDGSIYSDLKTISFVGSQDVLEFIKSILQNKLKVRDNKLQTHGKIFKIQWNSRKDKKRICRYLYENSNENSRLERKYNLAMEILNLD